METAKLFMNGRSQAVRLPKDYRFEGDEVCVAKINDLVILFPKNKGWDLMKNGIEHFSEDFMSERDQGGELENRDTI